MMRNMFCAAIFMFTVVLCASHACAQSRYIVNDRTNDALWRLFDANGDLIIDENTEANIWFDMANAPGTLGPANPTALAISSDGVVVYGDQGNGAVYRLVDLNCDGDAQDDGESIVFTDDANAEGASFAFPTGVAFDPDGHAYVVNAGNAFGDDRIYRLVDMNGDGDAQDAGEVAVYVGEPVFGPGNGPYSPQEIFIDGNGVGYLRNSSLDLNGVYRFEDINDNGRADDDGEFTTFFDDSNASGVTVGFGFALEPDPTRTDAMYLHQLASGGVDEVVRIEDGNGDGDAQDAGEAALVWASDEDGLVGVDVVALDDGSVLLTDNGNGDTPREIIRLVDMNGDGDFMDEGERVDFFPNKNGTLAAIRQAAILRYLGDLNDDATVGVADLLALLAAWGESDSPADLDQSGVVDVGDLLILLAEWGDC